MIVRAGAPYFGPGQMPLSLVRIPTVEGRERFGGRRPTGGAGAWGGGRFRGLGSNLIMRGLGADYCRSNPPDPATVKMITDGGGTVNLIDCAYSTGARNETGIVNSPGPFNLAGPVGTQPVQNLPAPPQYEDCTTYGLATSAAAACVQRNTAAQTAWEILRGQRQADYNRAMCIWNGQAMDYCNQVYPPGYSGSGSPTTTPIATDSPQPPTFTTSLIKAGIGRISMKNNTTGNNSVFKVGDSWSIAVSGIGAGAPVNVSFLQHPGGASLPPSNIGNADGSGNFTLSGTMTADEIGSWVENWTFSATPIGSGEVPIGSLSFSVVAAPQPAASGGGGSGPSGGGSVSTGSGGAGGGGRAPGSSGGGTVAPPATTFDIGGFLTGSMLGGIPNWVLLAAIGAAVLALGGSHGR